MKLPSLTSLLLPFLSLLHLTTAIVPHVDIHFYTWRHCATKSGAFCHDIERHYCCRSPFLASSVRFIAHPHIHRHEALRGASVGVAFGPGDKNWHCGYLCGKTKRCVNSDWKVRGPCQRFTGGFWLKEMSIHLFRDSDLDPWLGDGDTGRWTRVGHPGKKRGLGIDVAGGEGDVDELGVTKGLEGRCEGHVDVNGVVIEGHYFRVNYEAPWDVTGNLTHALQHGVAYKDLSNRVLEHEILEEDLFVARFNGTEMVEEEEEEEED